MPYGMAESTIEMRLRTHFDAICAENALASVSLEHAACIERKTRMRIKNNILAGLLTAGAVSVGVCMWRPLTAEATNSAINDITSSITKHENELGNLNDQISSLQDEQDILQEEIDDLNSEIINTMTSIGLKEDEIAEKEAEIEQKKAQIEETQAAYEAAVEREEAQRENMMAYTRMMYEKGDSSYLSALLEGKGLSDILNRMGYIERVYQYANQILEDYIGVKDEVHDLWDQLEEEKASLENDMDQLEADHLSLKNQQENLNVLLAQKEKASSNYDAEIAKAKQEAAAAKKLIQQEQKKLKELQTQLAKEQAAAAAAKATYATTDYSTTIANASGSELGKQVARFACQYIGNPYVYGGTSLTKGADCSGFIYTVYGQFGYSLPRTSYDQRSAGKSVSYDQAQPGDIICYDGHVGIYIGGGLIVHASNSKPYPSGGIKVSKANYRTILSVRRIIK